MSIASLPDCMGSKLNNSTFWDGKKRAIFARVLFFLNSTSSIWNVSQLITPQLQNFRSCSLFHTYTHTLSQFLSFSCLFLNFFIPLELLCQFIFTNLFFFIKICQYFLGLLYAQLYCE